MRKPICIILFLFLVLPLSRGNQDLALPRESKIPPQNPRDLEDWEPAPDFPREKRPIQNYESLGLTDFFDSILSMGKSDSSKLKKERKARKHYLEGQMLLQQGKYGEALRNFEETLDIDKEALKPRLQIARCYLFLNQYTKTLKTCEKILKDNPQYVPALLLIAKTRELSDDYPEAEKTYQHILSFEPNNMEALRSLGTIYYQHNGNVADTIEIYHRILELNRKDIMALILLGSAYAVQGNVEKSLEYYSSAVHYRPGLVTSYLNLAKLFEENRDFEAARKVYHKALTTAPENDELHKGYQSFLRRSAIQKYSTLKASRMNPDELKKPLSIREMINDKELHAYIEREYLEGYQVLAEDQASSYPVLLEYYANTLMRYNRFQEEEKQYRKILERDPSNYKALVALGNIALFRDDEESAMEAFDRAIAINPDNTEVYSQIGAAFIDRKEYRKALDLYQKAIRIKPEEEKLRLILYNLYEELNMDREAEETLTGLLEKNPENLRVNVLLGDFYRRKERQPEALESFKAAWNEKKSSRAYASMIVTLLLELDRKKEAVEFAEKAIDHMKKKKREFITITGLAFSDYAMFEDALRLLEMNRELAPDEIDSHVLIASVYNRMRQYEKAVETIENLEETHPDLTDTSGYFEILASVYMEQKNTKKADEMYREALERDPKKLTAYLSWCSLYTREKNYKKARDIFEQALKHIDRNSEPGIFFEARVLTALKEFDKAEPLFQVLLRKNPEQVNYVYNYALMCYDAQKFEKAETLFRKVLKENPDNADAYNNLGYMLAEQGIKLDEAKDFIKKALYLRPGAAYMIDSLGWVYYQKGDYITARKHLLRAESLSLEDPVLYDHLGDTFQKLGDLEKAREYWKRAFELDPDIPGLKGKIKN